MEEKKHCKWYNDEFCTNDKSPCVADYCPVVEYPELCKCRELDLVKEKSKEVNDLVKEKKLTDEEIVRRLEYGYNEKTITQNALDLIHRLQGEIAGLQKQIETQRKIIEYQDSVEERNAELQRQVDELTEENEYLKQCADTFLDDCERERKQADKDTAKEILQDLFYFLDNNSFWLAETGNEVHYVKLDDALEFMRKKARVCGVEVEE